MILRFLLWLVYKFAYKGGDFVPLVTITVSHIIAGRRTFTQVPAAILSDVEADLFSLGFGTDGKLL